MQTSDQEKAPHSSDDDFYGDAKQTKAINGTTPDQTIKSATVPATKTTEEEPDEGEGNEAIFLEDQLKDFLTTHPPRIAEAKELTRKATVLSFLQEQEIWLDNEKIQLLLEVLEDNDTLIDLHLGGIAITEQGVTALTGLFTQCKNLKDLDFWHNSSIGVAGTRILITALQACDHLDAIGLGGLMLNPGNTQLMKQLIDDRKLLKAIGLRSCHFHAGTLTTLMEAVKPHPTLEILDLSGNNLVDITAVARMLEGNQRLIKLDLSYNRITDSMIGVLTAALPNNKHLKILKLKETESSWGDNGAASLSKALQENHHLQNIALPEHGISSHFRSAIATRLEMNSLGKMTTCSYSNLSIAPLSESKSGATAYSLREKKSEHPNVTTFGQITWRSISFHARQNTKYSSDDNLLAEQKATSIQTTSSSSNTSSTSEASSASALIKHSFLKRRKKQRENRRAKILRYRAWPNGRPQDEVRECRVLRASNKK